MGAQITQDMVNVPEQVLTPTAGYLSMYFKDNQVWLRTAAGADILLGPGSGGPGSGLPPGSSPDQSLIWNGSQWLPSSVLKVNTQAEVDGRLYLTDTSADVSPGVVGQLRHVTNDIEFYDGTQWVSLTAGSGSNDYTRPDPVKEAVGGLTTSYVPNGTIQDILDDILYPFQNPSISLAGLGIAEKGVTVNPVNLNYSINVNDGIVSTRELRRGSTVLANPTTNSGSFADTSGIEWNSPSRTWTFEVTYSNFTTQSVSRTLNFFPPSYWGELDDDNWTESDIKNLLNKVLITNNNRSYTYNPGSPSSTQRMYFVYPQSFGPLNQIIDPNSFDITASYTQDTGTFTLLDGTLEPYYIYYSNQTTQTSYTITYS